MYYNTYIPSLTHSLTDRSMFWASPKRPPTPLVFDVHEPSHYAFVSAAARLFADVYDVPYAKSVSMVWCGVVDVG